ncbi:MAG: ATP-binding protein, partial [Sciscionella sp.]
DDPYRGLYLTPEAVQRILDTRSPSSASGVSYGPAPSQDTRLGQLVARFGLIPLDVELLVIAMAPDIDARFERLYGYLNDDVTRRRPTVGLALELCGMPAAGYGRFRFGQAAPLVAGGLVEVCEPERPLLSRSLRVPDRVVAHLLGDDEPAGRLHGLVTVGRGRTAADSPLVSRVAAAVGTGDALLHLRDVSGDAATLAVDALVVAGHRPLVTDVVALVDDPAPMEAVRTLVTESRLSGGGIVFGPLELLEPRRSDRVALLRELCTRAAGTPVIVYGTLGWDPMWTPQSPLSLTTPPLDPRRCVEQWRRALSLAAGSQAEEPVLGDEFADEFGEEFAGAVAPYRLGSDQVRRAASLAVRLAELDGRAVRADDLRAAVRTQNGAGLERLARRITPAVGWGELVLPDLTRAQLGELALRARHREQVLGQWRMRPGGGRGRGVTALFAGRSGTGKTMSAEVIAAELGMELYVVDLSTVVDKYIGETEKNLERIFTEAAGVNGVLLFDEADAIFGKRSQVKDAHDRHANVESAYLLQRMESFDGIAVLTTNLRANLDEAFTRRLDVIADFPLPDAEARMALWDRCLGADLPRGEDLDLEFCARRFELTGGSIRACTVTAAYLAAEARRPVGMAQIIDAVRQEYRKLGHLLLESEFGPWLQGQ